jgi:hypothetical protein
VKDHRAVENFITAVRTFQRSNHTSSQGGVILSQAKNL